VTARRALWLVALGALALRLAMLLGRGDYIVYDEGYYLLLSRSLRAGHGFTLNGLPHVALSPLQPVLVALLSLAGVPDLWASRLLAAVCGALLVFPVAALARLAGGPRAGLPAAAFAAVSPALMSFVPFFPGQSWNLYFGSEPLFLLLAFSAVAAAVRLEMDGWKWPVAAGALASAAYLTRLEGAVLAGTLLVVLAARLAARRAGVPAWRRLGIAAAAGLVVAAPYLGYLHGALGRWALSGRVQAASSLGAGAPSAVESARSGGRVLEDFVWQGEPDAFLRGLYGLDASGTRMASQYWGVHREPPPPPSEKPPSEPAATGSATAAPDSGAPPVRRGALGVWWRGVTAVVPWWFLAVALAGVAASGTTAALPWILPLAVCATLPSLLAYVEPRSLLPLAPLAAVYAGVLVGSLGEHLERRGGPWLAAAAPAAIALVLLWPGVRDLARAWSQTTPLQQVATARRSVGEYLARHLPPDAVVMSWHPAIAIWAQRPWRVLPYASFERIAAYAHGQRAAAIVFSRFEPSPIRQPPRAFTIVLPGAGRVTGGTVRLEPVDETPLLFVGRLPS
jgi:4-amino-4-deoxy-L-arabinose transferase-like glycosyltransferase